MTYEQQAELIKLARNLLVAANTVNYCYTRRPGNFAAALANLADDAARVRDLLAQLEAA